MATPLDITIKTTERFIVIGDEWAKLSVTVTALGIAVKSATVAFSISDGGTGSWEVASAITNKDGLCETRFKADEVGYYTLQVTATKSPYTASSLTLQIMGYESQSAYVTENVFYYSFLEQKKIDILKILQKVLDNDKAFYISTGGSDPIQYLTEWNFALKNFPAIIAGCDSPTISSIGINPIIDNDTRGHRVSVGFNLNLVAESVNLLDRMVEKVMFLLSTYKYYEFYARCGVAIEPNSISCGSMATEEYAAKYLFGRKISFKATVEMAYNFSADDVIEDVTAEGTIDSPIT
jgi:hypothetical protein